MYLNVNSILSNKIELERVIEIKNPAIILCSETCTTNHITDQELCIQTYKLVRCDSHSRHTGGTMIYIHDSIEYNIKYNKSIDQNIWCIFIKLKHFNPKWQIGVVYHSPSTSDADFINYLRTILGSTCEMSESNILIGDFNINLNNTTTYSSQLIDLFKEYSMHQKVNFDTV